MTTDRPGCAECAEKDREIARLRKLVRDMIENDPDDLCADGGITVLMVWRKDARAALGDET